jgi:hypothetical protein
MRISVEAWRPEYGGETDLGAPGEAPLEPAKTDCETRDWRPLSPVYSGDMLHDPVAFVDGTMRIDARVFVSPNGARPHPGVASSVGAGVVTCVPPNGEEAGWAHIDDVRIGRVLAVGGGTPASLVAGATLRYDGLPVPGSTIEDLRTAVVTRMRGLEAQLATDVLEHRPVVFLDGPLNQVDFGPVAIVGVVKSHQQRYLAPAEEAVIPLLEKGQRTPLFALTAKRSRYSWYLRLCERDRDSHGWHGLVRCEAPSALPITQVRMLADSSAVLLPRFASLPHWDKRAPQNLVPVAGLEKKMRHLLGDRELVYRMIRDAALSATRKEIIGA